MLFWQHLTYWITRTLKQMALNESAEKAVFKGGTSLFKGYGIGSRFSEDIDIAVSGADAMTGNKLKTLIKAIAKEMTAGMDEVDVPGVTSKGSRYYKAMYAYPNVLGKAIKGTVYHKCSGQEADSCREAGSINSPFIF